MPFGVDDEHVVSLLRNQDTARLYWDSHIVLRETEFSLWKSSPLGTDRSRTRSVASHIRKFAPRTLEEIT